MNSLVEIKDEKIIVSEDTINKLKEFNKAKIKMDIMEKEIKSQLKEAMKKCGIKQFVGSGIYADITQVKGKTTIDVKALKAELPEIAEQYTKIGEPSERFTFKIVED